MRRRRNTAFVIKELNEISNTPLIDISMLLLITFLITYPVMENSIQVNLPKGKADELQPQQTRNITLKLNGEIFLDDRPVTLAELQQAMEALPATMPNAAVLVRADKDLKYERVIEIMRMLKAANITKMALVTQAE